MMAGLSVLVAIVLIVTTLVDTFEVMILPRRVRHGYRLARFYYRSAWIAWRSLAIRLPTGRWRNALLGVFGPLSILGLVAVWVVALIFGFGLLQWALHNPISAGNGQLSSALYLSGTTFFTLGYGDIVPTAAMGRVLAVVEAGLGFGFLAVVISYLPVLYQAFSRREIVISLLDARAGSPPTAGELLRRLADEHSLDSAGKILDDWERWSAELLESHLSFPVLSYYRSQHDNQSWLAALTTILDTSALLLAVVRSPHNYQARLTFAMARHAAVDLGLVFSAPPKLPAADRLLSEELTRWRDGLAAAGTQLNEAESAERALAELRALYEPFVNALAEYFLFVMPPILPAKPPVDNWQTSAWMGRAPGLIHLPAGGDEHFD